MEVLVPPQTQKLNSQTPSRKSSLVRYQRDLWLAVREGTVVDVDSALALLKKNGGNVNLRNVCGLTPLHIATWRNHIPIVRRLLAAGADPDARDGESGWSSLHRALHFGHLAIASFLIQSGASVTLEDTKSRTPVDLVSGPVAQVNGKEQNSVATEVFSWGSGANYQLGTGNQHVQKLPCKVDTLHGCFIKLVSAAKFHSVAVSSHGEVYTWGFGRGGRLGHPDFDIHSGQAAVITPRQVTYGLGSRRVKAIAAAKHHTVIATEGGEVFTWGSNREGQLGYTSVDTQPTPRRVSSLKLKVVAVSAANKHTAVVSESGEVFTWGCNREGQLGYGTSNSASNYSPRLVDYLKGKVFIAVACAKYHTLALRDDGEVYTWGHRLVTPRRVVISRNLKKAGSALLNFHQREQLRLTAIAAGTVYSMALAEDGALFYWLSSDCNLRCQQLYSLCGKSIVSISAGKYWAAAVTSTGDVYMWDGKKGKDKLPVPTRLLGLKRATSISVGETHLLVVGSLYHPAYFPIVDAKAQKLEVKNGRQELGELDEGFMFNDIEFDNVLSCAQHDVPTERAVPSLKSLCERVAAECLVEPRNAIQLLEIADSLGAESLKKYCEDIAIRNLDFILSVSSQAFASASPDILANLEKLLDSRSSEAWSFRQLPTPTAMFPVVMDSEEESESDFLRTRDNHVKHFSIISREDPRSVSFLQPQDELSQCISRQVRALRKKLQQIEILEAKQSSGHVLDSQQVAKLQTKSCIESSLTELGISMEVPPHSKSSAATSLDGRVNRKTEGSRKKKKKSKQRLAHVEASNFDCIQKEVDTSQVNANEEISQVLKDKDNYAASKATMSGEFPKESDMVIQKKDALPDPLKNKGSSPTNSKKKNRKGGLSMFLSGALDDTPKPVVAPKKPENEGPAWGGAKIPKGSASLREIQKEQSKTQMHEPMSSNKNQVEDGSSGKSEGKIPLSSFLTSKPIPVTSARTVQQPDAERRTPPWASLETPPHLSQPSLRDIQLQQVKKKQQSLSHSPKTRTSGFSVSTAQSSPSDSPGTNRWFKPEVEAPSSIRSIQVEEKAMKDLRRFYSSVKVVKNQLS